MTLESERFGATADGTIVRKFTVANSHGLRVGIMDLGATLCSVRMPGRGGALDEITLTFDTADDYLRRRVHLGSTVGRCANLIARGTFTLDGQCYALSRNDQGHHLHGGFVGFGKVVWRAEPLEEGSRAGVHLSYHSRDGEEGYPGDLDVTVTISLTEGDELIFQYGAVAGRRTPVNLTNHAYWNLAGAASGTIAGHELLLNCGEYLPTNTEGLPTGEVRSVIGTPMDFTTGATIGPRLSEAGGFDHCFVRHESGRAMEHIARARDPASGRTMDVWSTMPAIQLYTGNQLDEVERSAERRFLRHAGLCLETEYYPDAVNHPGFPSCILEPGAPYHHVTSHRFSLT